MMLNIVTMDTVRCLIQMQDAARAPETKHPSNQLSLRIQQLS